ncbi:MAG: putative lipoprotein [Myxococcaceae bacterium]|nr:putative lipoprotein [Myxococcaceae bacterium]
MSRASAMAAAVLLACAACGPLTEDRASAPEPSCATEAAADAHEVDPFMELLVIDEAVTQSPLAQNANGGPLGFRHTMEQIAGSPDEAQATTLAWLEKWAPPSLTKGFDLAHAPFRLIGVANRIDLSEVTEPVGTTAGEARLLFGATDGPGDDPASRPLPITVIVELHLVGDRTAWAKRWHALGAKGAPGKIDAEYTQALVGLVTDFVHGENLAQLRVNDAATEVAGTMLEFHRDAWTTNPSARFVTAALAVGPLPASTCHDCHGGVNPTIDAAFHVSPLRQGPAKLSRFLFDPAAAPGATRDDELERRAALLRRLACPG